MKRDFVAENPNNLSRKLENRIIEKALKKEKVTNNQVAEHTYE